MLQRQNWSPSTRDQRKSGSFVSCFHPSTFSKSGVSCWQPRKDHLLPNGTNRSRPGCGHLCRLKSTSLFATWFGNFLDHQHAEYPAPQAPVSSRWKRQKSLRIGDSPTWEPGHAPSLASWDRNTRWSIKFADCLGLAPKRNSFPSATWSLRQLQTIKNLDQGCKQVGHRVYSLWMISNDSVNGVWISNQSNFSLRQDGLLESCGIGYVTKRSILKLSPSMRKRQVGFDAGFVELQDIN